MIHHVHRLVIFLLLSALPCLAALEPVDLRCEYRDNPLGIDVEKPRLSWILEGRIQNSESRIQNRGIKQTAYRILVASSERLLKKDQGDLWDTGKVESDQSVLVDYSGKPLPSGQQVWWKVKIWDGTGKASSWSQPGIWSMGLLKSEDWQAKWVGCDRIDDSGNLLNSAQWIWFPEGNPTASAPVGTRYFRRVFELPAGRKIAKAVIQITADNAFELQVNGKKAGTGDNFTQPSTVDLTGLLKPGANTLAVAANNVGAAPNPAGLIAVLQVEFADGPPVVIGTDAQWKAAPAAMAGWERTGFDDALWVAAKSLGAFGMGPWGNVGAETARRLPARQLRREFAVEKKVARATAYVCGLGFFDLYLNGKKVSDQIMNPALSDYRKAAYYVTFDVTDQIKGGRNALGVILGNGRFFAPRSSVPAPTVTYGYPKLRLQLEIQYRDGTSQRIVSDEAWKLTCAGPIRASNEYDGEDYDARLEMPGWCQAGFDDSAWEKAQLVAAPGGVLLAQMIEPMRVTQVLKPLAITQPRPGVFVVDFGQNFYGAVRLKAKAPRDTEVRLVCAYSLLPDGMLKTADNRGARATDIYTFKGVGNEVWAPQFKGQGFRRVQVTGFPGMPTVDNFEGLVIHTDSRPVGEFSCSNDLVNRLHQAVRWGTRMFLRSAPLDPDRDERQAWMGDPAKDSESQAFNFNVAPFYTKWMDDVRRSQRANGTLPDVSMNWEWGGGGGVEWPSVFTIIPDWFLDFYADQRVVETQYAAMKRWVQAMHQQNLQADGTLKGGPYGDWCDAATMDGRCGDGGATSHELIATAYHCHNCRILARAAQRLNQPDDAKLFSAWADQLQAAFNKKYFNPATQAYQGGTQCASVVPLAFGLVPPEHRQAVVDNLVNDILVKQKGHLSVGLIGMQWLMPVLTDAGRPDVAWTLATQTTRPSWGYMLSKGATTIWERWDCDTRDPGMNSEALLIQVGTLDAWFYQTLAGINYDRQQPGFKHILIKPAIVGDLTWVNGHHDCQYGRIISNWKRAGDNVTLAVTIPPNTTATVFVPARDAAQVTEGGKPASTATGVKFLRMEAGCALFEVGSGSYSFASTLPPPAPSRFVPAAPVVYPDGRPGASWRLDAVDQGVILKHGDGPGQCDLLGAREALIFEEKGVYHLFYDGAGPKGWLACLATSRDLKTWTKKGPVLEFGKPGEMDAAAATSPWLYFDGNDWHMFYLGTPHTSPAPDLIPAFPYLTLKAKSKSLGGPWLKQPEVIPFRTKPGSYYADTASPGHIVKQGDEYLQFFSASMKRTLGIARTKDLNGAWTIDPAPIVPPDEQVENSSLYFEPANQTWFLFTNHIGLEGGEYTDAIWVYWSKNLNVWKAADKAVVLDGRNCLWSRKCIGMPSVVQVGNRLAIFYDAPGGDSKSHMQRDLGLAWLTLPLTPPTGTGNRE